MKRHLVIAALLVCCGWLVGCASSKGSAAGGGAAATEGGGTAASGDDGAYRAGVEEKIEANMGAVQECFDKTQAREKTLSGKVSYEWTIRSDGKVDVVEVKSSTMNNGMVEECIKRVITDWTFATPPRDNFTVSHSFVFAEKTK